ncbi:MAG: IS66 family transposase [Candidatus Melainabacteria bacterium]|nr:IS66 family transposase [Candidatus Melainabacteria bacterium]
MATPKATNQYPYTKESLCALDKEAVIDLLLSLDAKYQQLGDYVRDLVNQKYGRKNERFDNPAQLLLFAGPDIETPTTSSESETAGTSKKTVKKSKPGHSRNQLPKELPRVAVVAPPPDSTKLPCFCCGTQRIPARQILQNSRYEFIPASFYVEDLYSVVYECPNCQKGEDLIAPVPEPVENGLAGPGLLAQVAVSRDFDHLPFNRQSTIYKRSSAQLSRSTLSDFYAQVARILTPLYNLMHLILLQSKIISTDDTPVKVLDRSKEKNIKTGRKWAFLGDAEHPVNLFHCTDGRGRDGPLEFLKGWKGLLQGDCFSGNIAICAAVGTVLVACLAHARRYFIKALLNDRQGCNQALVMFQSLYEIERTAQELEVSKNELKLMREQESLPILETFHKWLQEKYTFAQPKSSFGKALFYCLNNWSALTQYVTDGDLKIDNNHTEREMKYIAMGKHAWLFFGSDKGARDHAIVLSVLSTCRRHGVEPWAYLKDVIRRLTEEPDTNLEELLPYNWKQKYPERKPAEITVVKDAPKVLCA